ncbi:MAG TPA: hypothetical protein VL134_12830 [Leptolyngbya sp.]|nr:hypothetical protein [Leptolyngbya sp.]
MSLIDRDIAIVEKRSGWVRSEYRPFVMSIAVRTEDGGQFAHARANPLDVILTRDLQDFAGVPLLVWSIADLRIRLS